LSPEMCPESFRGTFLVRDWRLVTLLQWPVIFLVTFVTLLTFSRFTLHFSKNRLVR